MRRVGADAGTFGRWFATAPLFETVGAGFVSACELSNPDNELTLEFFPHLQPSLALQTPRWAKFLERAGMSDTLTRASVLACARKVDAEADVLDVTNATDCAALRDRAQLVTTTFLRNFAFLKKSIEPLPFDEWAAAMRYAVQRQPPPTPPPATSERTRPHSRTTPHTTHRELRLLEPAYVPPAALVMHADFPLSSLAPAPLKLVQHWRRNYSHSQPDCPIILFPFKGSIVPSYDTRGNSSSHLTLALHCASWSHLLTLSVYNNYVTKDAQSVFQCSSRPSPSKVSL